jgi:hypothetical protein
VAIPEKELTREEIINAFIEQQEVFVSQMKAEV